MSSPKRRRPSSALAAPRLPPRSDTYVRLEQQMRDQEQRIREVLKRPVSKRTKTVERVAEMKRSRRINAAVDYASTAVEAERLRVVAHSNGCDSAPLSPGRLSPGRLTAQASQGSIASSHIGATEDDDDDATDAYSFNHRVRDGDVKVRAAKIALKHQQAELRELSQQRRPASAASAVTRRIPAADLQQTHLSVGNLQSGRETAPARAQISLADEAAGGALPSSTKAPAVSPLFGQLPVSCLVPPRAFTKSSHMSLDGDRPFDDAVDLEDLDDDDPGVSMPQQHVGSDGAAATATSLSDGHQSRGQSDVGEASPRRFSSSAFNSQTSHPSRPPSAGSRRRSSASPASVGLFRPASMAGRAQRGVAQRSGPPPGMISEDELTSKYVPKAALAQRELAVIERYERELLELSEKNAAAEAKVLVLESQLAGSRGNTTRLMKRVSELERLTEELTEMLGTHAALKTPLQWNVDCPRCTALPPAAELEQQPPEVILEQAAEESVNKQKVATRQMMLQRQADLRAPENANSVIFRQSNRQSPSSSRRNTAMTPGRSFMGHLAGQSEKTPRREPSQTSHVNRPSGMMSQQSNDPAPGNGDQGKPRELFPVGSLGDAHDAAPQRELRPAPKPIADAVSLSPIPKANGGHQSIDTTLASPAVARPTGVDSPSFLPHGDTDLSQQLEHTPSEAQSPPLRDHGHGKAGGGVSERRQREALLAAASAPTTVLGRGALEAADKARSEFHALGAFLSSPRA